MARAVLSIALLFTQPVAPAPPGAGGETSTDPPALASTPNLVAAQPVLLTVDAGPAPETASTAALPVSEPMVPPPPEPWPTDAVLAALRMCESTNRYTINTGNSYFGAVQWLRSTWNAAASLAGRLDLVGVSPEHASPSDQDALTRFWWNYSDPSTQWPVCSRIALKAAA